MFFALKVPNCGPLFILPLASDKIDGEIAGYKPTSLIPILTKSIQELIQQVNDLKKEVELLKSSK